MKRFALIALAGLLAACTTTEFRTYEAKNNVFEGQGGSKSVHDGMDIWETGEPPRKYKLLGYIEDERGGGGISMAMQKSAVVAKAKQAGGDALIRGGSQSQVTGYVNNATATGGYGSAFATGFSAPVVRTQSRFAVIKYLD